MGHLIRFCLASNSLSGHFHICVLPLRSYFQLLKNIHNDCFSPVFIDGCRILWDTFTHSPNAKSPPQQKHNFTWVAAHIGSPTWPVQKNISLVMGHCDFLGTCRSDHLKILTLAELKLNQRYWYVSHFYRVEILLIILVRNNNQYHLL